MEHAKRILVVDDEPFFCDMLQLYLLKSLFSTPMNLVSVSNGKEALLALQTQSFDLMITDYSMPIMNGVDLIKAIEKLPKELHPGHVIMISGDCPDLRTSLSLTQLDKPINFEKLKNILRLTLSDSSVLLQAN